MYTALFILGSKKHFENCATEQNAAAEVNHPHGEMQPLAAPAQHMLSAGSSAHFLCLFFFFVFFKFKFN